MKNLSKFLLTTTVFFGIGAAQPNFAQDKNESNDSTFNGMAKNTKEATFETSYGKQVIMLKYIDEKTQMDMASVGTNIEGYIVSILYTKKVGFIVTYMNQNSTSDAIFAMGSDGKMDGFSKSITRETAENMYATALYIAAARLESARQSGKTVNSQLTLDEINGICHAINDELDKCSLIIQRLKNQNNAQPQKFEVPKKGGEPLYNSSNYHESKSSILAAIKANERRVQNVALKQPFIRNRLQAKA